MSVWCTFPWGCQRRKERGGGDVEVEVLDSKKAKGGERYPKSNIVTGPEENAILIIHK